MELTDQNFKEEIQKFKIPVLVDFFAQWCGPCSAMAPILEKLAKEREGKLILAKVNIDSAPVLCQELGIDRIPAIVLFKEGRPVSGFVGLQPELVVKDWLEKNLFQEESIENIIEGYRKYAEGRGWKLNPDLETVKKLISGLLANEKKHGARYCPCRRVTGNKEDDQSKVCPCSYSQEDIDKSGRCLCGLFEKG